MNSEDIKKIAESMGYDTRYIWDGVIEVLVSCDEVGMEDWQIFDPYQDDSDTFMVLSVLVSLCPKMLVVHNLQERGFEVNGFKHGPCATDVCTSGEVKVLNEAICKAYLSLIKGE